jgi:hypothetical protein
MTLEFNMEAELCERPKALGYTKDSRIRIYGEEFDLTSNPVPDENGFAVEAVSRKSGSARKLRIPLSIVRMITKDLTPHSRRAA